jgi:hypothetical protein
VQWLYLGRIGTRAPLVTDLGRDVACVEPEEALLVGADLVEVELIEAGLREVRYDRLADLRDLVLLLADSLAPRGVNQWLHARNRPLDGRRPLDLIRDGEFARVREAAEAFIEGSYV